MFTFGQLYFLAPAACVFFAFLGDKYGRKRIIINTAMIMAVASLAIVILPTYETWGENATILLLMLRVIQGIALAGEPTAANLYLIENTSLDRSAPWYTQAPWYIKMMGAVEEVGGMAALLLGYLALTVFKDHSQGWRLPFVFCAIFVVFLVSIRKRLSESEDYQKATSNRPLNIFDEGGMSHFYKSVLFQHHNILYWILLLLPYPIVFSLCFLHMSPQVIHQTSGASEDVLLYNTAVSMGSVILSLASAYFPLKYTWDLRKTTAAYVSIGSCLAFVGVWCLENCFSVSLIYVCQIFMMSLINFGLVMPGLLKAFPVVGRYSLMGIGWGIARVINFILIVMVMTALEKTMGFYGLLGLLYGVIALALLAVYAHVSCEELDTAYLRECLKDAKPVEEVYHILTAEEAHQYMKGHTNK